MTAAEMQPVFAEWNKGELDSYLIEITSPSSATRTPTASRSWTRSSTSPSQKGTGKWTVISAAGTRHPDHR